MTFELSNFNIGIQTIVFRYINTGLASSAENAPHEGFSGYLNKLVSVNTSPKALNRPSELEKIEKTDFRAATGGKINPTN